jgi:hypothetical protein
MKQSSTSMLLIVTRQLVWVAAICIIYHLGVRGVGAIPSLRLGPNSDRASNPPLADSGTGSCIVRQAFSE